MIFFWTQYLMMLAESFATNRLAQANTRSRFRMVSLYQIAGSVGGIVAGTGNKVEDYGVENLY